MAVSSEGERLAVTPDDDRWHIVKHQFAIAMSLANTGRGLARTSGGDSSPYSFGTSIGSGWIMNDDGSYEDPTTHPGPRGGQADRYLARRVRERVHPRGRTLGDCFTSSTAQPSHGESRTSTLRHQPCHSSVGLRHPGAIRTWYRVNSTGPAMDDVGDLIGKRDSHERRRERKRHEPRYPQYTAYHAWQINNWLSGSPP